MASLAPSTEAVARQAVASFAAVAGDSGWTDVVFSARLRSLDDDAIGVLFRYGDENNYYRFSMDATHRRLTSGATMLRGGAFKPRTSPYTFSGLGEEALQLADKCGDRRPVEPHPGGEIGSRHVTVTVDVTEQGAQVVAAHRLLVGTLAGRSLLLQWHRVVPLPVGVRARRN